MESKGRRLMVSALAALVMVQVGAAAEVKILLPLGRTAYQTNEWVDVSVVRGDAAALPADSLTLTLTGDDGSRAAFVFPVGAVAVAGKDAQATEHLHLNGWLLRPGHYKIEVAVNGGSAAAEIDVFSHLRKSTFKLIDWGDAQGAGLDVLGEESMGFNVMYGHYRQKDALSQADHSIRGGLDYMQVCTMGGAHQMDIRLECDWSDPYVTRGGTARVVQQAFLNRTTPNCLGVHFYDEPGLTWHKHPVTGEWTCHGIPAQVRAFKSSFGQEPIPYNEVKADNPESVARWEHWARWKLSFVESAWKESAFGVSWVRPDYLSANQSQYAWYAYADGYYFNVVRSLPVISGHGGYDDMPLGYHHPAYYYEFGRMRDLAKDAWYLPCWYGNTPPHHFRLEQYLSFMMNVQGMMTPPDMRVQRPSTCAASEGIVESNLLMGRLGTIFSTMAVTRPETAVLYSISQCHRAQAKDMKDNYDGGKHRDKLMMVYLASKLIQQSFFPIVEEDVLDGTLAAHHKAVILAGIDDMEPRVVKALEAFAAGGGIVLATDDSRVEVKGATKIGAPADTSFSDKLGQLWKEGKQDEMWKLNTVGNFIKAAEPLAKALKARLAALGLKPVLTCDEPGIVASRQAAGDVEYLFAANAAYDFELGGKNSLRPAVATIGLSADDRPVYDAVLGSPAPFAKGGGELRAKLRFGPGQMRVFARTARPIGSVAVSTPTLVRDYTVENAPLRVELAASVLDDQNRLLSGSTPLQIRLMDPLGTTRADLFRATKNGVFRDALPLAANDPAGEWRLTVRELISNREGSASFAYSPAKTCAALAGATGRAVVFKDDRQNVYRLFRTHQDVTVVKGKGDYDAAAARVAEVLAPWGVRCTAVNAADVAKPRELSEEEAKTWVGMVPGRTKPGRENPPVIVGFDLKGHAILLGTPQDNPLIDHLVKNGFLPYAPSPSFPGRGRGMIAWQLYGIGHGQESVTLIAYDAAGMAEAIGTLYEIAAGLTPLTPWTLPVEAPLAAATKAPAHAPAMKAAWEVALPDRAAAVRPMPDGKVVVLSQDGSLTALDPQGKEAWKAEMPGGETWLLDASADGGLIAVGASQRVVAFDARGRKLFETVVSDDKPPKPLTCVAVSPDGKQIAAGTTDGQLALLSPKGGLLSARGRTLWTIGGVSKDQLEKWQADHKKWEADMKAWEDAVKAWDAEHAPPKGGGQPVKPPKVKRPEKPAAAEPKKPVAEPYLAALFSPDGKTLVAATAKGADAIAAADGKAIAAVGGVSGKAAPVRAGANTLMSDGNKTVALVSPAEGKLLGRLELPKGAEGVVALAATADGFLVGTESDGTVRKLKALEGKAEDQTAWAHQLDRRIPKKLAVAPDGLVAVAYWGGTLNVLDPTGAVKFAQALPQDIADLAWSDGKLVVGLADGRVMALEAR